MQSWESIPCDSRYEDTLEEPVIVESSGGTLKEIVESSGGTLKEPVEGSKDGFVSDFEKCFLL